MRLLKGGIWSTGDFLVVAAQPRQQRPRQSLLVQTYASSGPRSNPRFLPTTDLTSGPYLEGGKVKVDEQANAPRLHLCPPNDTRLKVTS